MGDDRMKITFETARSIAIRIFINYIAKIHEPLNVGTLVSNQFPMSDNNGDLFKIKEKDGTGIDTLHKLWDTVMYKYEDFDSPENIALPFKQEGWDKVGKIAAELRTKYP